MKNMQLVLPDYDALKQTVMQLPVPIFLKKRQILFGMAWGKSKLTGDKR